MESFKFISFTFLEVATVNKLPLPLPSAKYCSLWLKTSN
jgi:hypothetical protein